ncbi:hypothetical protein Sjap_025614 [Stephania japonica]|uniref:Uncharacterized protein n=1 Tax=Stephania japonica TaxID=461633 RepID=A0AAP0E563_9MAGN
MGEIGTSTPSLPRVCAGHPHSRALATVRPLGRVPLPPYALITTTPARNSLPPPPRATTAVVTDVGIWMGYILLEKLFGEYLSTNEGMLCMGLIETNAYIMEV